MFLVSDIGGTNTRVALADNTGVHTDTIVAYRNEEQESFLHILRQYRAKHSASQIEGCCVAIAGPVTSRRARLTNRDWDIVAEEVGTELSTGRVLLINDLAALGNSVEDLQPSQLSPVGSFSRQLTPNDQSLIVGIGTGFNLCAVQHLVPNRPACLSVEYGHCGLPASIADMLKSQFGEQAQHIKTVEECFAGRGFQRLYALASNRGNLSGGEIMAAHHRGGDPAADQVVHFYVELLAALCRELILQYLPLNGIYFAGSVARGVLGAVDHGDFASAVEMEQGASQQFQQPPMSLITDDAAALVGCLRRLTL